MFGTRSKFMNFLKYILVSNIVDIYRGYSSIKYNEFAGLGHCTAIPCPVLTLMITAIEIH